MNDIRIDKWLWNVRLFKSRSKASKACKSNNVSINDITAKPSGSVSVNDIVRFKKNGFNLTFRVLKLLEKRRSYSIARECYSDLTPESEYNKYEKWYNEQRLIEYREKGTGRPTKKERREIDDFKTRMYDL